MIMRTSTTRVAVTAVVVAVIVGCASAPIKGRLSVPGQAPVPAVLSYQSSLFGGSGKLWTTLPEGETFKGKYVLSGRDTPVTGTLDGDRGSVMLCRFQLNEPGVGPDKGGTVRCEVSSGGVFDASF
jgi:hypothetical protein